MVTANKYLCLLKQPNLSTCLSTIHFEHSCSFPAIIDHMYGGKG